MHDGEWNSQTLTRFDCRGQIQQRTSTHTAPELMLERLQGALAHKRCSVSFEVVTRALEHHGQVPAGEYLVATAMTRTHRDGRIEVLCSAPQPPQSSPSFCVPSQCDQKTHACRVCLRL
jgi:hypothetical protein